MNASPTPRVTFAARMTAERDTYADQLDDVRALLIEIEVYLASPKFHGADNDYAHVTTDILPKVRAARVAATPLVSRGRR
ncbi:hypothetical protein CCR94_18195 [Rhodoblastus sphagnicola]|uniref:Uncharacterized protein n=1 Tax=Rhodoblastus sphagnicola TaxID=333368 RepID=A0A2S6N0W0_9HYPH|nr:hypothetical protein [Rhodoblastus sphagnicola]MBB4200586.1 hypothetical protein [Rhodoblastus sphagnicola]PPQ28230.1 hypothetical protein CCR94_18195 [Rhodoblastus sphagnicola]